MKEEKEVLYWTMKNGTKVDIDQMSENHLRNTLKMIVRNWHQVPNKCTVNVESAIDLAEQDNQEPYCDDWMWK
jgi:hypothetical protein